MIASLEPINSASWQMRLRDESGIDALADQLAREVDRLRRALRGEPCQAVVVTAFTDVEWDADCRIDLPFGVLRAVTKLEREFAPPSMEGTRSHGSVDGDTITVSVAGDLVLETTIDYRLVVQGHPADPADFSWPAAAAPDDSVYGHIETIRLALELTRSDDRRVGLTPTWTMVHDPLSHGPLQSWSALNPSTFLEPVRLTQRQQDEFARWIGLVNDHRQPDFAIAIRRTISATAQRTDATDSLVDLVIAWENLFGSTDGEPTLRLSASMAWLLGEDADDREQIRSQVAKIYGIRSKIVHGNSSPPLQPVEIVERQTEARELTTRAWRKLFADRPDILALGGGTKRSARLIVGAEAPTTHEDRDSR